MPINGKYAGLVGAEAHRQDEGEHHRQGGERCDRHEHQPDTELDERQADDGCKPRRVA